jgi:hypothetical protein
MTLKRQRLSADTKILQEASINATVPPSGAACDGNGAGGLHLISRRETFCSLVVKSRAICSWWEPVYRPFGAPHDAFAIHAASEIIYTNRNFGGTRR